MKTVHKVLAYLIALEVMIQASLIAFAVAGIGVWVQDGGSLDEAAFEAIFEGDLTFTGVAGMMFHGLNGMMVIPSLALLLLIVSFFAKVPGGIKWAAAIVLLVVLQVTLGIFGHEIAVSGALHGINALVLFSTAAMASKRVSRTPETGAFVPETPASTAG